MCYRLARSYCIIIGNIIALKMSKVLLLNQARTSIFTCQNFISLKIAVHILSVVFEGDFPKRFGTCTDLNMGIEKNFIASFECFSV